MNIIIDNLEMNAVIDGFSVGITISDGTGSFTGIHFHPFFEIHFILAGQYKINAGNRIMTVYAGDVIIMPPEMPHNITPAGNAGVYDRTAFWFDTGKIAKKQKTSFILDTFFNVHDIALISKDAELINMISAVRTETENKKPSYIEFVKNGLINIIILLCRHINEAYDQTQSGQYSRKNIILSIKSYINANYSGECTLKKLSEELNICERYLYRLVCKSYSRNFRQLLLETRMSKANYLIEDSDMSFREIAAKTGYSSVNAFYNAYGKFYKMTP